MADDSRLERCPRLRQKERGEGVKIVFLGGKMHMKMLHDNPDFAFSYGWTIEGEHYVHCGRIKDNIEVMGHSDDK